MKFKKAISAFAALAISVSCFAGLSITASAEDFTETGELAKVRSFVVGAMNTSGEVQLLDDVTKANTGPAQGNWFGVGINEMTFTNANDRDIYKATLSFKAAHGASGKTGELCVYTFTDEYSNYDISTIPLFSTSAGSDDGWLKETTYAVNNGNYSGIMGEYTQIKKFTDVPETASSTPYEIDVTNYVKALTKKSDNKYYAAFMYSNANRTTTITDQTLTIQYIDPSKPPTSYTIKYVDGDGNDVKTAVTEETFATLEASVAETEQVDFKTEDGTKKYIYVSTSPATGKITCVEDASENVITLTFREAPKTKYTIKTKTSKEDVIYEQTNFEGEKATVPYSRYILEGSTLYKTASYGTGAAWGAKNITFGATDTTDTIDYTAQTGVFVYASEGENIEGMSKGSGNYANTRASNGAVGYSSEKKDMIKLPAGTYKITAQVYGNAGDGRNAKFYAGENLVLTAAMAGNPKEYSSETFTLTEPTMISATSWGGNAGGIDDVIIERTAAPTSTVDNAALDVDETADGDAPVAAATDSKTVPAAVKSVVAPTPTFNSDYLTAYKYKTLTYVVTNPDVLPDGTALTKPVLKVGDTDNVDWTGIYDAAEGKATYKAVFAVPTNAKAAAYSEFGKVTVTYGGKVATYNLNAGTAEVTDVPSGS